MQSNPINDINVNDEVDVDIVRVDTHVSLLKEMMYFGKAHLKLGQI